MECHFSESLGLPGCRLWDCKDRQGAHNQCSLVPQQEFPRAATCGRVKRSCGEDALTSNRFIRSRSHSEELSSGKHAFGSEISLLELKQLFRVSCILCLPDSSQNFVHERHCPGRALRSSAGANRGICRCDRPLGPRSRKHGTSSHVSYLRRQAHAFCPSGLNSELRIGMARSCNTVACVIRTHLGTSKSFPDCKCGSVNVDQPEAVRSPATL